MTDMNLISIIIPVYGDWGRLAQCLQALAVQDYPAEQIEVIVVNNHPADQLPTGWTLSGNCRVIHETKPGSYAARNSAIRIARGEIIGFTDSDCIPCKEWIREAVACFADPACDRIAGRIKLFYHGTVLSMAEQYEQIYAFNQDLYVKRDGTGVTANLFVRKELFDQVGLFNEELLSGGDYEWSVRAGKAGYRIAYAEKAVVLHPAGRRMSQLVRKARRVGGGQAVFMNGGSGLIASFFRLLYDLRPPFKSWRLIGVKGKELSFFQKLRVGGTRYYLSAVSAYEKFRVRTGKKPARS